MGSCTLLFFFFIEWGNFYELDLNSELLPQKRLIRIITFSSFLEHTSPFFKSLKS